MATSQRLPWSHGSQVVTKVNKVAVSHPAPSWPPRVPINRSCWRLTLQFLSQSSMLLKGKPTSTERAWLTEDPAGAAEAGVSWAPMPLVQPSAPSSAGRGASSGRPPPPTPYLLPQEGIPGPGWLVGGGGVGEGDGGGGRAATLLCACHSCPWDPVSLATRPQTLCSDPEGTEPWPGQRSFCPHVAPWASGDRVATRQRTPQ